MTDTPHMTEAAALTLAQAIAKWAQKHGYTAPIAANELRAVERCQILDRIGVEVTAKHIERELAITRAANERAMA